MPKSKKIKINVGGLHPRDIKVSIPGLEETYVQRFKLEASIDSLPKLTIEAFLTNAEIEVIEKATEIKLIKQ